MDGWMEALSEPNERNELLRLTHSEGSADALPVQTSLCCGIPARTPVSTPAVFSRCHGELWDVGPVTHVRAVAQQLALCDRMPLASAVGWWSRGDGESEAVGGRGRVFSSSSQAVFLSFSQIYFLSAEVKRGGCCSDDSCVHANRNRGRRWYLGQKICSRTVSAFKRRRKTNRLPFYNSVHGTSGVFSPRF